MNVILDYISIILSIIWKKIMRLKVKNEFESNWIIYYRISKKLVSFQNTQGLNGLSKTFGSILSVTWTCTKLNINSIDHKISTVDKISTIKYQRCEGKKDFTIIIRVRIQQHFLIYGYKLTVFFRILFICVQFSTDFRWRAWLTFELLRYN